MAFLWRKLTSFGRAYPRAFLDLQRNFPRNITTTAHLESVESESSSGAGSVPATADTVIIGGGVVGTSVAYHLAKAGVSDVVLLEKTELTAGSTWHAAGLTTYYHGNVNLKKFHYYSLELYKQLEEETGQDVGLHECGTIRLASTPERALESKYHLSRQGFNDATMCVLSPDEIMDLHPLLNRDKLICGLYTPGDGHTDPYSLTMALAKGARQNGARICQHSPVLGMSQRPGGGWSVDTPGGTITARRVVNAGGFHARDLGRMVGLDLPLLSMHHQYIITSAVPELRGLEREVPVIRDLEGGYYMRQERAGLLFGPYEQDCRWEEDWYRNGVDPGFGKELFEGDLDRLSVHLDNVMEMCPSVERAEIQRVVSGPIVFSPDLTPMVGPHQGFDNYWCAYGAGYGIIQSGGVGKFLADWMTTGEPPYEAIEAEPNRYGSWAGSDFCLAKSPEAYRMNNSITYPFEERPDGRPTSRNHHLLPTLQARGAQLGFHAGWEQPNWFALPGDDQGYKPKFTRTNWFEPVGRECDLVMNKAGVIDLSPFGKLEVKGPDAARFLDKVFANTVPEVGHTNISHMITPRGRVYSEMTVTHLQENEFLLLTGSGSELHDLRWMEEQARAGQYDLGLYNITDEFGAIGLAGPRSRDILQKLVDIDVSDSAFPFLTFQQFKVGGAVVSGIRISYTGELGWELYTEIDNMPSVYSALMQAGEEYGVGDFGTYALNSMRLEKGFRMWGNEMSMNSNPFEAGLGYFIKMKKDADFIGKAALKEIKAAGLKRKVVFLTVDTTDADPMGDESVWYEDKVVGSTTSGAYGYNIQQSIAFAYVPIELSKPGTEVQVELLGKMCPAIVQKGVPLKTEVVRNQIAQKAVA